MVTTKTESVSCHSTGAKQLLITSLSIELLVLNDKWFQITYLSKNAVVHGKPTFVDTSFLLTLMACSNDRSELRYSLHTHFDMFFKGQWTFLEGFFKKVNFNYNFKGKVLEVN